MADEITVAALVIEQEVDDAIAAAIGKLSALRIKRLTSEETSMLDDFLARLTAWRGGLRAYGLGTQVRNAERRAKRRV